MKFKRLFAAILSALMIVSCFSFTASAQETQTITDPLIAVQTAKANGRYNADNGALTKTKLYDAVNDTIFYRFTPVASAGSATTKLDNHGLDKVTVTDGVCYMAIELRSNYPVEPWVKLYNTTGVDGNAVNGTNCYTMTAASGEEAWERIVIKIEHSNLAAFTQNHFYLFSPTWTTGANTPADAYVDITAFAYFNDEYSALNYDFSSAVAADGAVTFSINGEETDVVPESDPEVEGKYFMGWSADENATSNYESLEALTTIPTEDTTYYAILTGAVEDEKAVYISAAGDDSNSGRHSKTPVATFAKANEIFANTEGVDTIYIVGGITPGAGVTLGNAKKSLNLRSYNGSSDVLNLEKNHFILAGDLNINDIGLYRHGNDGGYQLRGYNLTVGDNVVSSGNANHISQGYYTSSISDADGSVANVNSGNWGYAVTGNFTAETYTGNVTHNFGGTANVSRISGGHGNGGSNQRFNGTYTANISGNATVGTIDFSHTGGGDPLNTHYGARLININGGSVNTIKTTSNSALDRNADVTVVTINGGTVGTIAQNLADTTNKRVVIFNDGVDAIDVTDNNAYVLDVTGGTIKADVTVADDFATTLNGFTFELAENYFNAVKIGDSTIVLETLTKENFLPINLFTVGVNNVEFVEVDAEAMTAVYVSDSGDDNNKGNLPTAPVKTLKKVNEILAAKETVETVYIVGTVTATKADRLSNYTGVAIGTEGRKITYLGYTEDEVDDVLDAHDVPIYLAGDVEMDDFFFQIQTTWDGRFLAEGHNITIGENMAFGGYTTNPDPYVIGGTSVKLGNIYYNMYGGSSSGKAPTYPWNNTYTIKSGAFENIFLGIVSGTHNFTGRVVLNAQGAANIKTVTMTGHGSGNTLNNSAHYTINVSENATITKIQAQNTNTGSSVGGYRGLREIFVNGGTVGTINTTGPKQSNDSKQTAGYRTGVTVIEVNGGTVGAIAKPFDDEEEASTVAVIFNDGVDAVEYADSEAYILDVTGGTVKADTTVSEDYTTATLNKFTFTPNAGFDGVRITAGETSNEYALADLNGEISLDKLTVGVENDVEFILMGELDYVAAKRTEGYEIVYVAAAAKGNGTGLTPANAYGTLPGAMGAFKNKAKVLYAIVDNYYSTANIESNTHGKDQDIIITSGDGTPFHLGGQLNFGGSLNCNILIDNVELVYGGTYAAATAHETTGISTDDRSINAKSNDLTIGAGVTFTPAKFGETARTKALLICAYGDGGTYNNTDNATITLLTGSNLYPRAGSYWGTKSAGGVEYIFAGNVNIATAQIGGHNTGAQTDELRTLNGDLLATVKENAHIGTFNLNGNFIYNGNAVINVIGGTVDTLNIQCNNSGDKIGRIKGDTVVYYTGGTITNIGAGNDRAGTIRALVADTDKVTMPAINASSALTHIISYNGNNGTVTVDTANNVFKLTPNEGVKYVKITNGETVTSYTVAGDEVTLMADLSAMTLATGTTTVEFLTDGTELSSYTLNVYTMGTDGQYGEPETSSVDAGAGTTATYNAPEMTGFTLDDENSTLSGTVAADGSLELNVYYIRNQYKLYTKLDAESDAVDAGTYYYGAAVAAPEDPEKANYEFKGWDVTVPETMPANDVTLTATWEASTASYTVNTYVMGTDGEYGEPTTETKSETVGKTVSVEPEEKTGFTVADTSVLSGTVTADGNLVLSVYYSRNQYKLYTKLDAGSDAVDAGTYYYGATVTAPADPEKANYEFKGWDVTVPETMPANDVTLTATWEAVATNMVYISNDGDDANTGLTATSPVKHMTRANALLAEDGKDTLVIVGRYTNLKDNTAWGASEDTGVAGKTITITGYDETSVYDMNANTPWNDEKVKLVGDVVIKNIILKAEQNDGYLYNNGYKLTIGEGITYEDTYIQKIYPNGNSTVEINSANFQINAAGTGNGTITNSPTVTINGGDGTIISLGKGNYANPVYRGKYIVTVNGGNVQNINISSTGAGAENSYAGLRYFTINGGTVGNIITTASDKYMKREKNTEATDTFPYVNGSYRYTDPIDVAASSGVTVFEINTAGAVTGTISPAYKKVHNSAHTALVATTEYATDAATRIIIFNNGTYEEGKVLDTGAITVNVVGGSIKADATMADDYTTTLNGYTFTVADESYDQVVITPATGEAKTYKLAEIISIPAADLVAGTNKVEFSKYVPTEVTLNFYDNVDNTEAWVSKVVPYNATADVAPLMSDYKNTTITTNNIFAHPAREGYWFKGWATTADAAEAETVVATADADYYAVWEKTTILEEGTDFTLTKVTDATASGIPEEATFYAVGTSEGENFFTNTTGYTRGQNAALEGLTAATSSSYFGGGTQTTVLGQTPSIWYKWQNGSNVNIKPGLTGQYDVAFRIYAAGNEAGTLTRGFYLEAGDVAGTVHLENCASAENTYDRIVTVRVDLTEDSVIAYSAARDFDDVEIQGAQFLGVYIWEPDNKIYISNDGSDDNDGLTATTPVRTLTKANALLAAEDKDTLVVVGTFTIAKDGDVLGVAGKTITVTGNAAGAVFDNDAKKDGTDDDLVLAGNIIFKNIAIYEGSGDGVIQARGNTVTFAEGITLARSDWPIEVAGWSGSPTINIASGSYNRIFPGTMSGTYKGGTTTVNVSGGTVANLGLGWGYMSSNVHNGAYYANIDGGTVKLITLRSGGVLAANTYKGLRYYTINDGIVESIVTTGGSTYNTGTAVAARTGHTVFVINKAGVVTGNIALGTNVLTNQPEADDSTRIIIFNNNSYKAGQVTDTGAITVEVRNGAIKADVTMAADYTTTLGGYTFTTDKAKVNINGTNYDAATLGGKIDANKLAEGYNLVIFTDADLAPVKWVVGETETEDLAEVGGKLTAPAVTVPAPTKETYYTFEGWTIGEDAVDFETYTLPAEGATITATLRAHTMPLEAVKEFDRVYAMNNGVEFTSVMETIEGVEAAKAVYSEDTAEHADKLTFEGWNGWPTNHSVNDQPNFVNGSIYKYAVVKYYYVPGTNTEARKLTLRVMGINKTPEAQMETGKWSYAVYDISGDATSNQFHLRAMDGVNIGTLVANNEVIYVDTLAVYQNAPTVATITFKGEDGATLYAIDAINGEAVAFYGDAPTKDNHTFLGWAIEGTTDVVDSFAFTVDTALVPVFEENEPVFPTTAQYKTYGIYDELAGTYTVELKIAGGVFNQGAFGFNFPTEQMTFVSAAANEEAGIKFLTGTPVTETDKEGYYAAAWYATEDIAGKADASAAELTLVTFEFTMTPEQRAAFVVANATLTEYVNTQPDDAEAFAKYHNGTNYLVAPHEAGPSIERQAVVYMGHVDEVEENAVEYRTYGTYDAAKGTYYIDVKVIGGKFNLGAFGLAFDSQYMTYDPEDESALVLAEDIANYLGVTLANTAEGVAFVWDGSKIEGAGYVDATDAEVLIATIKTAMTPEQRAAFVAADTPMSTLAIENADYFANGNYLVRPYTNGLNTPKVEAVYASHSDDEAEITTAAVTVKVTFAGKTGATAANIGYISVDGAEAVAIDAAGNTEATVEYVIADAAIGDEIELEIFKNGYIGATVTYTVQATANVIEITTIPGDIKGTADALCGDGKVSLDDFVRIIRAFDSAASDDYKASVDLDESGAVNVTDIGLIKTNFGKTTDDVTVVINGQAQ